RQHSIWLNDFRGIFRIGKSGQTTVFTAKNGLTTNVQTSIFQDYENNMWFTNDQTGLCKFSKPELAYYPIFKSGFDAGDIFIPPNTDSVWLYDGYHREALLLLPNGQSQQFTHNEPVVGLPRFISAKGKFLL